MQSPCESELAGISPETQNENPLPSVLDETGAPCPVPETEANPCNLEPLLSEPAAISKSVDEVIADTTKAGVEADILEVNVQEMMKEKEKMVEDFLAQSEQDELKHSEKIKDLDMRFKKCINEARDTLKKSKLTAVRVAQNFSRCKMMKLDKLRKQAVIMEKQLNNMLRREKLGRRMFGDTFMEETRKIFEDL